MRYVNVSRRKITIDGNIYEYTVSKNHTITIFNKHGRKHITNPYKMFIVSRPIKYHHLFSWDDYENNDAAIKPKDIEEYLMRVSDW